MAKRKIIRIDEAKCNGCGQCIPNCPEGALQVIDGKARLVSDLFCDGLGACIGYCPQNAITTEEREAEGYDENKVMANIVRQGENVIKAHLAHLEEHKQGGYLKQALNYLSQFPASHGYSLSDTGNKKSAPCGCPGAKVMDFRKKEEVSTKGKKASAAESQLRQWPVQIMLVPTSAPYLNNADLLIAADCVPFAYAGFHQDLLKGKALLVGCPKLDDVRVYEEKFVQILKNNNLKSITYAHMEVPCCFGLVGIINSAIASSGKTIPFKEVIISIKGERKK